MKHVLFTGGGSAGHVTPNLALMERLTRAGWGVSYIGSYRGIERSLVEAAGVPYTSIATGKLRRYWSPKNLIDPFLIVWGCFQALIICRRRCPDVVFSKGGFVAVPVVIAAWLCRIPVVCHESDVTPGLATRLCAPIANVVCINFEETAHFVNPRKILLTGTPLRRALTDGDRARGLAWLGFSPELPVLLVFCGSLGAARINDVVRQSLPKLMTQMQVVHVVGEGRLSDRHQDIEGYLQVEFIGAEFGDVLMSADVVVSRAGANSLYELIALRRPHLLIPLPLTASRGDQIQNARAFQKAGMSRMLAQEDLSPDTLIGAIERVMAERVDIVTAQKKFDVRDSATMILSTIGELANEKIPGISSQ